MNFGDLKYLDSRFLCLQLSITCLIDKLSLYSSKEQYQY